RIILKKIPNYYSRSLQSLLLANIKRLVALRQLLRPLLPPLLLSLLHNQLKSRILTRKRRESSKLLGISMHQTLSNTRLKLTTFATLRSGLGVQSPNSIRAVYALLLSLCTN